MLATEQVEAQIVVTARKPMPICGLPKGGC
jgi:hypothetical protein